MLVLPSLREKADLIANINRDNSPPEATFTRGLKSSPGLVEIKNSTVSFPSRLNFPLVKRTWN